MLAHRGTDGLYPIFHAILYVENPNAKWGEPRYDLYNWSYWMLRFMPTDEHAHAGLGSYPLCSPLVNYVDQLTKGNAS